MLASHLEDLRAELRALESLLLTNEATRELLASGNFLPLSFQGSAAQDAALRIKYHSLSATRWRTLDHATTMLVLYANYERFVYQLMRDWLAQLPAVVVNYNDLLPSLRRAHLAGTANILQKHEHQRYHHLSIPNYLRELANARDGVQPYSLLPDTFFTEDENLRRGALEGLFARVGLENPWGWITAHPSVVHFIDNVRGGGNTVEGELAQFVGYRNDAAHGNLGAVLGLNALLEIRTFVECICEAILEFVRRTLVNRCIQVGRAVEIGRITESFHHGATAIGTMRACSLDVNDELIIVCNDSCPMSTVLSIRDNDVDRFHVDAVDDQELGLRLSVRIRTGMILVRVLP